MSTNKDVITSLSFRIAEVRRYKSMTQQIFSDFIGVSRSYLSQVERGDGKPSIDMIIGIALKVPEISERWLLTGQGAMFKDGKQSELNIKEYMMLELFRVLPEGKQGEVLSFTEEIKFLVELRARMLQSEANHLKVG